MCPARQAISTILFTDHEPETTGPRVSSVVAPATRSQAALRKPRRKHTEDGLPAHSFRSLMSDLATLTKNTVRMGDTAVEFTQYARPTELQERAFQLLDVSYRT